MAMGLVSPVSKWDRSLTPKVPLSLPSLRTMSVAVGMVRPNFTEQDKGDPFSKVL